MADKQLNVSLNFNADTSKAKKNITDLQKSLQELSRINTKGLNVDDQIKKASQAAKDLRTHLNNAFNVKTGNLDITKFNSSIKSSNQSLKTLSSDLLGAGLKGEQAFINLSNSIMSANIKLNQTRSHLSSLMTTFKNSAKWQISSSAIHAIMGAVNSAYGYVQDLNKSLTNIRIVTGQSSEQMAKFAEQANKSAKALSTTTTAYTDAALIFYQQGLSDKDVKERTDAVIKMAQATGDSATEVSSYMTAIWNNFDNGSESLEHYADVITALGASTASSSAEIAEGLEKFAAVAQTAGLSYEYATSALATVVAATRQSADTVGTAFKTLFARIQDLELGKTLDDGTDLGKYSQALATVGVNIKDVSGNLKSMDTILDELGSKWKTLGEDTQIAVAQAVAGTRQYTQLVSLMENYDTFKTNVNTANNAEGTLQKQADIYAESWEAASKRARAAMEGIFSNIIDDNFFIKLTDGFAKVVDGLGGFIKGLGGMKTLLLAISTIALKQFGPDLANSITSTVEKFKQLDISVAGLKNNFNIGELGISAGRKAIDEMIQGYDDFLAKNQNTSQTFQLQVTHLKEMTQYEQELQLHSKNLTENEKNHLTQLLERLRVIKQTVVERERELEVTKKQLDAAENKVGFENQYNLKIKNVKKDGNGGWTQDKAAVDGSNGVAIKKSGDAINGINKKVNNWSEKLKQIDKNYTKIESQAGKINNKHYLIFKSNNELVSLQKQTVKTLSSQIQAHTRINSVLKNEASSEAANKQALCEILGVKEKEFKLDADNLATYLTKIGLAKTETTEITEKIGKENQYKEILQSISGELAKQTTEGTLIAEQIGISKEALQEIFDLSAQQANLEDEKADAILEEKDALETYGDTFKNMTDKTDIGSKITSALGSMSQLAMSISMVENAWKTLQDEDASFFTKLSTGAMAAGMAFNSINGVMTSVKTGLLANITGMTKYKEAIEASTTAQQLAINANKELNATKSLEITLTEKENVANNLAGHLRRANGEWYSKETVLGQAALATRELNLTEEEQEIFTTELLKIAKQNLTKEEEAEAIALALEAATHDRVTASEIKQTIATKLQEKADKAAAAAAKAKQLAMLGWIALAVVAVAAITALIIANLDLRSAEEKEYEASKKAHESAQKMVENTKNAYEELKTTISDYKTARDALSELKVGTEEWYDAINNSNEKAKELIETVTKLGGTVKVGANGELIISDADLDAVERYKQNQTYRTQMLEGAAAVREANAAEAIFTSDLKQALNESFGNQKFIKDEFYSEVDKIKELLIDETLSYGDTSYDFDQGEFIFSDAAYQMNQTDTGEIIREKQGWNTQYNMDILALSNEVEKVLGELEGNYNQTSVAEIVNAIVNDENFYATGINGELIKFSEINETTQAEMQGIIESVVAKTLMGLQIEQNDYESKYAAGQATYQAATASYLSNNKGLYAGLTEDNASDFVNIYAVMAYNEAEEAIANGQTFSKNSSTKKMLENYLGTEISEEDWDDSEGIYTEENISWILAYYQALDNCQTKQGEITTELQNQVELSKELSGGEINFLNKFYGGKKDVDLSNLTGSELKQLKQTELTNARTGATFDYHVADWNGKTDDRKQQLIDDEAFYNGLFQKKYEEYNYASAIEFANAFFNSLEIESEKRDKILEETFGKHITEKLGVIAEGLTSAQLTTIGNAYDLIYSKFGNESAGIFDIFQNESAENQVKIADIINGLDWTSADAVDNFASQLKALGLESTLAEDQLNILKAAVDRVNNSALTLSKNFDTVRTSLANAQKIIKDLDVGSIITDDDYKTLKEYSANWSKDNFVQTADGWKYIGKEIQDNSELLNNQVETLEKYKEAYEAAEEVGSDEELSNLLNKNFNESDIRNYAVKDENVDNVDTILAAMGMSKEEFDRQVKAGGTEAEEVLRNFYLKASEIRADYVAGVYDSINAETVWATTFIHTLEDLDKEEGISEKAKEKVRSIIAAEELEDLSPILKVYSQIREGREELDNTGKEWTDLTDKISITEEEYKKLAKEDAELASQFKASADGTYTYIGKYEDLGEAYESVEKRVIACKNAMTELERKAFEEDYVTNYCDDIEELNRLFAAGIIQCDTYAKMFGEVLTTEINNTTTAVNNLNKALKDLDFGSVIDKSTFGEISQYLDDEDTLGLFKETANGYTFGGTSVQGKEIQQAIQEGQLQEGANNVQRVKNLIPYANTLTTVKRERVDGKKNYLKANAEIFGLEEAAIDKMDTNKELDAVIDSLIETADSVEEAEAGLLETANTIASYNISSFEEYNKWLTKMKELTLLPNDFDEGFWEKQAKYNDFTNIASTSGYYDNNEQIQAAGEELELSQSEILDQQINNLNNNKDELYTNQIIEERIRLAQEYADIQGATEEEREKAISAQKDAIEEIANSGQDLDTMMDNFYQLGNIKPENIKLFSDAVLEMVSAEEDLTVDKKMEQIVSVLENAGVDIKNYKTELLAILTADDSNSAEAIEWLNYLFNSGALNVKEYSDAMIQVGNIAKDISDSWSKLSFGNLISEGDYEKLLKINPALKEYFNYINGQYQYTGEDGLSLFDSNSLIESGEALKSMRESNDQGGNFKPKTVTDENTGLSHIEYEEVLPYDEESILQAEQSLAGIATTLLELENVQSEYQLSQEGYAAGLINIASGYDSCKEAALQYANAIRSGDENIIKATESNLKFKVKIAELSKASGIATDEIEAEAKALKVLYKDSNIVETELAEMAKEMLRYEKGVAKCKSSLSDWTKEIKNFNTKGVIPSTDTINDLAEAYGNILDIDGSNLSADFIMSADAIDLLNTAINGTEEEADAAYNKLQQMAQEDFETRFHLNTDEFQDKIAYIEEAVANTPEGIDIAANLEDEGFLDKLSKLVNAANMTADEATDYLSSMGIDAEVETIPAETVPVTETESYWVPGTYTTKPLETGGEKGSAGVFKELVQESPGHWATETSTHQEESSPSNFTLKVTSAKKSTGGNTKRSGSNSSNSGSSGSGGGGGGGGSTPTRSYSGHRHTDTSRNKYNSLKESLSQMTTSYDEVSKAAEKAFGKAKLDLLDKQIEKQKEIVKQNKAIADESARLVQQDLKELNNTGVFSHYYDSNNNIEYDDYTTIKSLLGIDVEVNADGTIANLTAIQEGLDAYYNSVQDRYNSYTAEQFEDEATQNYAEAEKERAEGWITAVEAALDQYTSDVEQATTDAQQYLESLYNTYDLLLQKTQEKVNMKIEVEDFELDYLSYLIDKLGDKAINATDKIIKYGKTVGSLMQKNSTYTAGIESIIDEHNSVGNLGISGANFVKALQNGQLTNLTSLNEVKLDPNDYSTYTFANIGLTQDEINTITEYVKDLKAVNEELLKARESVFETMDSAYEDLTDQMDRVKEKIESQQQSLEYWANAVDIVGKKQLGVTNETMKQLSKAQTENATNLLSANKARKEELEKMLKDTREKMAWAQSQGLETDVQKYKELIEKYEDEYESAQQDFLQSWGDALQAATDEFNSNITLIVETLEETISGKLVSTLSLLRESFDMATEIDEDYVADYEKIYQLTKLNRKAEDMVDKSTVLRHTEKLLEYQQEINQLLNSDAKLSEYDINYLEKKLDLLDAQNALENAQNAKSQVRMTADSEGNYGFVYTADAGAVEEAEQNYEDKLYEMQKANDEYITNLQSNMMNLQEQAAQKLQSIVDTYGKDSEEYVKALAETRNWYSTQVKYYASEMEKVLDNNKSLYDDDWTEYSALYDYKKSADADYVDSWNETILQTKTGWKDLETYATESVTAMNAAIASMGEAMDDYKDSITNINITFTGVDDPDIANALAEAISLSVDETGNLVTEMGTLSEEVDTKWEEILTNTQQFEKDYSGEIDKIIKKNEDLISTYQKLLDAWTDYSKATNSSSAADTASAKLSYAEQILDLDNKIADLESKGVKATDQTSSGYLLSRYQSQRKDLQNKFTSLDTGGYTGEWGTEGKIALLHQKELVLNESDTNNFLNAIDMVRQISSIIDLNAVNAAGGLGKLVQASYGIQKDTLEQNVHITAEFPNATDKNEIMEAFDNIIGLASQYANRK